MAATSTARWSLIFLGLGLLLPILYSLYLEGHTTLFDDLVERARQFAYGEPAALAVHPPIDPLENHHTVEARLLADRLRRDNGKWEKNHPRRRLMEGLSGYEMYRDERMTELKSWRTKFNSLAQRQRNLIDGRIDYTGKLKEVEGLMKKNARIADAIFDHGLQFYGIPREELNDFAREFSATANHRSGVMYAMKHIVRDWTPEGNHERDPTFPCILDALQQEFPAENRAQTSPRIIVPGAALGRLGHEIAALGDMEVITNEFSATMNLAWRYLRSFPADSTSTIYPNVDWWSHRATTASMTRGIDFPDNVDLLHQPSVELAEGDFVFDLKHYNGATDAVVTHFFIDTAKNIVSYLEAIHTLLKPGGIWINFGPLLYGSNPSIQLSLDEVIAMAEAIGMEIEEPRNPECGFPTWSDGRLRSKIVPYNADSESLSRNAYLAQFWVARKKA